jgi:hypothetical protein
MGLLTEGTSLSTSIERAVGASALEPRFPIYDQDPAACEWTEALATGQTRSPIRSGSGNALHLSSSQLARALAILGLLATPVHGNNWWQSRQLAVPLGGETVQQRVTVRVQVDLGGADGGGRVVEGGLRHAGTQAPRHLGERNEKLAIGCDKTLVWPISSIRDRFRPGKREESLTHAERR